MGSICESGVGVGELSSRKDKPSREYSVRWEKQGTKDKTPGHGKGMRSQGRGQGWLATRRALGRYDVLEAQAGGGSGRTELDNSIPCLHSVPEHLIHTRLTFPIIFTLIVAVGRFPSGSVILFAACNSHLSGLTGMSFLTLLEKVTLLNLALFANVS